MKCIAQHLRLGLAIALFGCLGACTVVPTYPVAAPRPVYVEHYPVYGYPGATIYYQSGPRPYYGGYRDRYYEERRSDFPLPPPPPSPRDVRRGLGLPRLPGLP